MGDMIKVLFYVRTNKMNRKGLIPIYMRVTISGRRFNVTTSRYVEPAKWSAIGEKMDCKTEENQEVNDYLAVLRNKAFTIQKKLMAVDKPVTIQEFSKQWYGVKEAGRMLIEIFKHHNQQVKDLVGRQYSHATWKRYETSLEHTQHFMEDTYKISDIDVSQIKYKFITDYEFWLKTKRNCNQNSTVKYLTNFKKIIFICIKNSWLDRDPFVGYKMIKREVEREVLNEEELKVMTEKKLVIDRIAMVRDTFLFCCYTGLAYIDVKQLKRTEIVTGIDGAKWIFTHREKTETPSRVPLLPPAFAIIERYKNHPLCEINLLPVFSNQRMNAYLKEVADLCGITKKLTTHMARHTFATTVTLNNGVPIETVSKMLGHRNLRTTQHYAKVLDKKVSEDMNLLKAKFAVIDPAAIVLQSNR